MTELWIGIAILLSIGVAIAVLAVAHLLRGKGRHHH